MGFNDINLQVSGPQQPASIYKTKVLKGQVPFAIQVTEPNTKYVIKHNFVLNGDVTIPANCVLEFDGGSLSNGNITTNGCIFKNHAGKKIFNSITFVDKCLSTLSVTDFGAIPTLNPIDKVDSTLAIQAALDSRCDNLYFPRGYYYVTSTLLLSNTNKNIVLEGTPSGELYKYNSSAFDNIKKEYNANCACIFTDQNIDVFVYSVNAWSNFASKVGTDIAPLSFVGGCIDVSRCNNYTKTAFTLTPNQFISGYNKVHTTIIGNATEFASSDIDEDNLSIGFKIVSNLNSTIDNQGLDFSDLNLNILKFDIGFYSNITVGWHTNDNLRGCLHGNNIALKILDSGFFGGTLDIDLQANGQSFVPIIQGNLKGIKYKNFIWDIMNPNKVFDEIAARSIILDNPILINELGEKRHQFGTDNLISRGLMLANDSKAIISPRKLPVNDMFQSPLVEPFTKELNGAYAADVVDNATITINATGFDVNGYYGKSVFIAPGIRLNASNLQDADNAKLTLHFDFSNCSDKRRKLQNWFLRFPNNDSSAKFDNYSIIEHLSGGTTRTVVENAKIVYADTLHYDGDNIIYRSISPMQVNTQYLDGITVEFNKIINNTVGYFYVLFEALSAVCSYKEIDGEQLFDVNKKIFKVWNGTQFVSINKGNVFTPKSGTFADAQAINTSDITVGYDFFATDKGAAGVGAMIYYTGNSTTPWVYADGTAVS